MSSLTIAPANGFSRNAPSNSLNDRCLYPIDSPTLVPCPTPVLTPANSLRRIQAALKSERFFYKHEPLAERFLIASFSSDSSDEAEGLEDALLSDRDCFRFDNSKAVLDTDDPLTDLPVEIPGRCPTPGPTSGRKAIGLGISGLPKRNVTEAFDGLGLVSIHRPLRRESATHHTTGVDDLDKGAYDSSGTSSASTSNDSISSTMLNETLLTFTVDPLHVHALNAISECRSWHEIGDLTASSPSTYRMFVSPSSPTQAGGATISAASKYRVPCECRQVSTNALRRQNKDVQHGHARCSRVGMSHGPARMIKPNFLSATISSQLKRSTSTSAPKSHAAANSPTLHARSATWPNRNESKGDLTASSSPNDHRKAAMVSQRGVPIWRV